MRTVVAYLPGNEAMARGLAALLEAEPVPVTVHAFPDEETVVAIDAGLQDVRAVLVCTLDRPNAKFLPLVLAAETARELGARQVGLVAPYLAYMRQDTRFEKGQSVSAQIFARQLSGSFDWLVTVDPHLHRIPALAELFAIPTRTVHAAPLLAQWISQHVPNPLLVGPDGESRQWVTAIAQDCGAPAIVLKKVREADDRVRIAMDDLTQTSRTPVLVDDILSTAHTMAEAAIALTRAGYRDPVCIGVHAVFAPGALETLAAVRPAMLATTNTIAHPTNRIDVSPLLAAAVRDIGAVSR